MQVLVCELGDFAVVSFENNGGLVGVAVLQIDVEAVIRNVQLTVVEPFIKWRFGLVQGFGKRLLPGKILTCKFCPETFIVRCGCCTHCVIGFDSGNGCCLRERGRCRKYTAFLFQAFNV